jgi:hypothetical protein
VNSNRISQGQLLAGIAAIALFIFSWLPWFGTPEIAGLGGVTVGGNLNMWEAENPLDIYLLMVILLALTPAVLAFMGGGGAPMIPFATALLGAVGAILIFYQLFDNLGDLKVGIWLSLLATLGITVGGYLSMQEEAVGERY